MKYISVALFCLAFHLYCYGQELVPFRNDGLWGFKEKNGVVKVPAQFQYASRFIYGMAIVAKSDSLGAIDENNNVIVPFHYHFLRPLSTTELLFGYRAKYFGEYVMGVITTTNHVKIPAQYSHIYQKNNCYVVTQQYDDIIGKGSIGDVRSQRTLYGMLDRDGQTIIPCRYDYLRWLNDSLVVLSNHELHNGEALFNIKGQPLTGFDYMVFGDPTDGMIKVRIDDKFGFFDLTGRLSIPVTFDYCEDFVQGYALIRQKGKWGAIDKAGRIVVQPAYEYDQAKANAEQYRR